MVIHLIVVLKFTIILGNENKDDKKDNSKKIGGKMLLRGNEVNPDNVGDWGSGTLKKFRDELEMKIRKCEGDTAENFHLYTLIDYQIAFNRFHDLTYDAANELQEELNDGD